MRYIIIIVTILVFATTGNAFTWYVPDDYGTIQEAIDAAGNWDTIVVHSGTYVENINFNGKIITVMSSMGPECTTIDGGNPANPNIGSVVTFNNSEGLDSSLEGFTITNGTGTLNVVNGRYSGGGIRCYNASPKIIGNIICKNDTGDLYAGGGIFLDYNCSPQLTGNTISGNSAEFGGGLFIWDSSSPLIRDNIFKMNTATFEGGAMDGQNNCAPIVENNIIKDNFAAQYAGGLSFYDGSSPTINNNLIMGNEVAGNGGGGIMMTYYCSGTISNNIIAYNTSKGSTYCGGGIMIDRFSDTEIINNLIYKNSSNKGGGIDVIQNSSPTIENNTILWNSASSGGGIACRLDSYVNVVNNIVWNNQASKDGPELFIGSKSFPSTVTISFSDVKGGQGGVYVAPNCTLNWGSGMIDTDPLFEQGPCGFKYLGQIAAGQPADSPCVDSGSDLASNLGMDTYFTRTDEVPDSGLVDMGYHYGPVIYPVLQADAPSIPESTGGTVNFLLLAGSGNALRNYLLVGGVSGTEPGMPLPGGLATLPVNWDWFSDLEMTLLNTIIFSNFMGKLDGGGTATAQLNMPPLPAGTAGVEMFFAFCCNNPFDFVSNPVAIEIVLP